MPTLIWILVLGMLAFPLSFLCYYIGFVLFGQNPNRLGRKVFDWLTVAIVVAGPVAMVASVLWIIFEGFTGNNVF